MRGHFVIAVVATYAGFFAIMSGTPVWPLGVVTIAVAWVSFFRIRRARP